MVAQLCTGSEQSIADCHIHGRKESWHRSCHVPLWEAIMNIDKQSSSSQACRENRSQAGFTLLEGMVVVAVFTVISGVVIPALFNQLEIAKLAKCRAELDGMKAMAYDLGDGRYIPNPEEFWGTGYPNAAPGEYYYLVDSQDHNKGHGNDLDGCDEENPGNSPRCPNDCKFVVLCRHDHGTHGRYCYATDNESPTVVTSDDNDPGYQRFIDLDLPDGGKPEGKEPKKGSKK
jgi:prepilin-type N-terminal cleavage/methylation domain-containing protein